MIHLTAQDWDIQIDPKNGSLFRRCRFKDYQVFRDFDDKADDSFPQYNSSSFPLLPFSNRIRYGHFEFEGRTVSLPVNAPNQTHVLHGYGWINPWDVIITSSDHCRLRQTHPKDIWPWSYEADQSIQIRDNVLRLELSIVNTDISPMPTGLGFHPFFADLNTACLTFDSQGFWQADKDVLPTNFSPLIPAYDLSQPAQLKTFQLDHCYVGIGPATVTWANSPLELKISNSDNLTRAAVYTAHQDNAFCFEPVTHTHNALNMESIEHEGMVILEPGQGMKVWTEIDAGITTENRQS